MSIRKHNRELELPNFNQKGLSSKDIEDLESSQRAIDDIVFSSNSLGGFVDIKLSYSEDMSEFIFSISVDPNHDEISKLQTLAGNLVRHRIRRHKIFDKSFVVFE